MRQNFKETGQIQTAVRLVGVDKRYGAVQALNDLSFEIAAGRFFVLFGPSSVGKTTTLRVIAGLETIDCGTIELAGRNLTHAPVRGRGVAMVFQSFALYPHLTVAENLIYPLKEAGLSGAEIRQRFEETVEMLALSHRTATKPATLSGGEQQRVALGRALIQRPRLLLLDEPLTNLDAKLRHDMRAELKRLHRKFGMTIIYATPDELEALSMGEDIAVLNDGHIVQQGSSDDLYDNPQNLYVAAKIGSPHMNLLDVCVSDDGGGLHTPFGRLAIGRAGLVGAEDVVMGIRPADIRLADGTEPHINLQVQLVEPLGDITIISLDATGSRLRMVLPESQAMGVAPGHELPVVVPPERVHIFRKADGAVM